VPNGVERTGRSGLITTVRVGSEAEEGLDAALHGETAYELGV